MNNQDLKEFLQRAKRKTFASVITIPRISLDKSKEYFYKEKDRIYKDKYFGSIIDTGQELVFYREKLIWSMSYRGGMIKGKE